MYGYNAYAPQEQYPPRLPLPSDFSLQQSGSCYDASSYGSYTANPTPGYAAYGASSYAIPTYSYNIYINGVRLNDNDVTILQRASPNGGPTADGSYWYDRLTGCWGYWGGPTQGWIMPGMTVGGDLMKGASGGNTGILVNGREMHQQELAALSNRGIQLFPGSSYSMDAFGRILNAIGTQITQLFPNPFAVQLQQMVLNCVPPSIAQGMPTSTIAQGMPATLPPSGSFSTPFNQDYSSYAAQPQQFQMPMQQQQQTQVPAKLSLLQNLTSLGNGKITPESVNTLLTNYSNHWSSDLLQTFLKGYISNLKKSKKHKKTVKLLEAGMKMLEHKYGIGAGSGGSATDKGFSEDMLGNMFDFEGTGLDRVSDALTKYSS